MNRSFVAQLKAAVVLSVFASLLCSTALAGKDVDKSQASGKAASAMFYMVEAPAGDEYCQKLLQFTNETYFNEKGELVEQLEWKSLEGKKLKLRDGRVRAFSYLESYLQLDFDRDGKLDTLMRRVSYLNYKPFHKLWILRNKTIDHLGVINLSNYRNDFYINSRAGDYSWKKNRRGGISFGWIDLIEFSGKFILVYIHSLDSYRKNLLFFHLDTDNAEHKKNYIIPSIKHLCLFQTKDNYKTNYYPGY